MENSGSEVIKGRGPDGVSYSSLSPWQKPKDAQKQHKLMAVEKIDAAAALLSAGLTPSPTPSSPSSLLLSEGMGQLELEAAQLCLPTVYWQSDGKKVKGLYPVRGKSPCSAQWELQEISEIHRLLLVTSTPIMTDYKPVPAMPTGAYQGQHHS